MAINKLHEEFWAIDMEAEWNLPAGHAPGEGFAEYILSGELDEMNKRGSRTRLLRFPPGKFTATPFVHEYWEEVFLVSGDLIVGNNEKGEGGEKFHPFTYACRPPGVPHGPFKSENGCLLLEIHYYDPV